MEWRCRERIVDVSTKPLVMGILNTTPDSFSDGGEFADCAAAVAHGRHMVARGAQFLDIGGESSRPGSEPVSVEEEMRRVIPVVEALADCTDALISVDTTKADVARAAINAGATIVNDISAMQADPVMARVVAESGVGVILMHMQGTPKSMQQAPVYDDVVADITQFLDRRMAAALELGIDRSAIALDPGIGFGKTLEHNLDIVAHVNAFLQFGRPVVMGMSRKRFLGDLTGRDVHDRMPASIAAAVCCLLRGVQVLRVHDVAPTVDACRVAHAVRQRYGDTWNDSEAAPTC